MKINKPHGLNSKVVFHSSSSNNHAEILRTPSAISAYVKENSLSDLIELSSNSVSLQSSVFFYFLNVYFLTLFSKVLILLDQLDQIRVILV